MRKKLYEPAEIKIFGFSAADVVATSGLDDKDGNQDDFFFAEN